MNSEPASLISNRRIALLIDADNMSHVAIATILVELSRYGVTNIRRAYGDWTSSNLKGWQSKLHGSAIKPIQQFSYSAGKNATDIALVIDAMELLYTQDLHAVCIASSDGDYTPLAMQLKANGLEVYGFGERKTPKPFVDACTTFLYVDGLGTDGVTEPAAVPGSMPTPPVRPPAVAIDEKLVAALRGGVEAAAREDGWAPVSSAGSAVKRQQASIDPRNYGAKTFTMLFEAAGAFEVCRIDGGQPYVADRQNADRTPRPVQ